MNKELFDSMREQMKPSPKVRAALSERLAQPEKRRMSIRKYAAVAACAALVMANPADQALRPHPAPLPD